ILKDPGGPGVPGRITLAKFQNNPITSLFQFKLPTINGGGTLAINSPVVSSLVAGLSSPPALPMAVSWPPTQDAPSLTFQPNDSLQQVIKSFTDFSPGNLARILRGMANFLRNSKIDALNVPIPGINKSVNDLLDIADPFLRAADEIANGINVPALQSA